MQGEKVILADNSTQSIRHGITFNNSPAKEPIHLPEDVEQLAIRLSNEDFKNTGEFLRLIGNEVRNHPVTVFKLFLIKAGRSWYGAFGQEKLKEHIKLAISVSYIFLAILGAYSWMRYNRGSRILIWFLLLITVYFWGMTTAVASIVRYMIPVFGLFSLLIPGILVRFASRSSTTVPVWLNEGA